MSRSAEYTYELEREKRQAIYEERVRATTERFLNRYTEQYEQMLSRGLNSYIPEEFEQLRKDLKQIRSLLVSDPTAARDVSFKVGEYIYSLRGLAESARSEFEREERMRAEAEGEHRKQAQNNLMNEYYRQLSSISPTVVHFAEDELNKLHSEISSAGNMTVSSLQSRLGNIIKSAEGKAAEWKAQTSKTKKKDAVLTRIEEAEKQVRSEKIEDSSRANQFVERLKSLKKSLADGTSTSEVAEEQLADIERSVDDTLITEEVRRQTVVALYKLLSEQDFTVENPILVKNGNANYVKLIARRPSGKQAVCVVDLHGKIQYRFDSYDGMTCLKDIEKLHVDLERVYSVKLSDERILWSNPDRLTKDAETMPSGISERRK